MNQIVALVLRHSLRLRTNASTDLVTRKMIYARELTAMQIFESTAIAVKAGKHRLL